MVDFASLGKKPNTSNQKPDETKVEQDKAAVADAANEPVEEENDEDNDSDGEETIFTSSPVQRLRIGRFQFERGVLTTKGKDTADFRALLEKLPARERNQVKTIDKNLAESMVRPVEPGMTKNFDSSVGRQRERLATGDKTVGNDPLEGAEAAGQGEKFAKLAQTDNNQPIAGRDSANVVNEQNQGDVDPKSGEQGKAGK